MNGLNNGLFDGLFTGQANGLFDGLDNGLHNGLFNNELYLDVDAQKFINAIGTLTNQQSNAINILVNQLKYYKIWNKFKAIYPFIGGTASSHKFNLINPLNTNDAFRLTFSGGWTHSSTGAKPNGTNAYADTYITPSINLYQNNNHISFYSRSQNTASGVDIRASNISNTFILDIEIYFGGRYYTNNIISYASALSNTITTGLFICNRMLASQYKGYRNGIVEQTNNLTSQGQSSRNIYIGAGNDNGSANWYSQRECAFASIGLGFTDVDVYNLYNIVQNYQTLLGRQV